jgi:hypothetical protein
MPGITLAIAQAKLTELLAAHTSVALGQRVRLADRDVTFADLEQLQKSIDYWSRKVDELEAKAGGRSRAVVLRPNF